MQLTMEETADTEKHLGWQLRWYLRLCSQAQGTIIVEEATDTKEVSQALIEMSSSPLFPGPWRSHILSDNGHGEVSWVITDLVPSRLAHGAVVMEEAAECGIGPCGDCSHTNNTLQRAMAGTPLKRIQGAEAISVVIAATPAILFK